MKEPTMYDPIKYWSKRKRPNPYDHVRDIEIEDLKPFIDQAHVILDYGVGTGRLMPLYRGKIVRGVDIVETYRKECLRNAKDVIFTWSKEIEGGVDLGVCTKVLLHEPNPKDIIDTLARHCNKVFISTAINQSAQHVFNHDYMQLLGGYDIHLWNQHENELHIVYGNFS